MNIFEQAARKKLRFEVSGGGQQYTVEQLFEMPLRHATRVTIDAVAVYYSNKLQGGGVVTSFLKTDNPERADAELKFAIAKHILDDKLADERLAAERREARENDQFIASLIAEKDREDLKGLTREQLSAKLSTNKTAAAPAATTHHEEA